jgi:hypothetical protein
MTAVANLVIADATPANKTLYPLSASIASSKFIERAANTALGNRSAEFKLSLASSARVTDRVTLLYARPIEVLVDGAYTVDSIARMAVELVIPANWTTTERGHFWAECKNLMALAGVQSYVKDLDPFY